MTTIWVILVGIQETLEYAHHKDKEVEWWPVNHIPGHWQQDQIKRE